MGHPMGQKLFEDVQERVHLEIDDEYAQNKDAQGKERNVDQ